MKRYFCIFIFLLCLSGLTVSVFFVIPVQAEISNDSQTSSRSVYLQSFSNAPRLVEIKGSHYKSKPEYPFQLKNYFSLYSNLNYEVEKNNLLFKVNGLAEFFFDKSQQFYFNVPEVYFSYAYDLKTNHIMESIRVYVGRHIKHWSQTDEYWELGTWNSLNLWDPLYPSQNGLIGAFLDVASKNWLLEFYVGRTYLPNVEPVLKNDKRTGKILSPSRWKIPPPETASVKKMELDINYLVGVLFERFLHDSYSLSFKTWAYENKNLWLKGSFGYKPVNDVFLITNSKNSLKVSDSKTKERPLTIQKTIENHSVAQLILSVEGGMHYGRFSALLSVSDSKVRLSKPLLKGQELTERPLNHTYFSGLANYKLDYKNIKNKFQVGYLHSLNGKNSIFSSYELYHKFLRGIGFDWTAETLSTTGLKRALSLRYWHSFKVWGGLFSLDVLYYILPKWYAGGRVNVLAGEKGTPSFLGRFRADDYISWRTGYVF